MSKEEIFNYFYTNSVNLGAKQILSIMLSGLLVAAIIYATYYISYRGVSYNSRFNWSLVIILLIAVVIMLMISSNIVISLGMVGALSIVRFRTAIKDSRDTVFIFWAIAEGLCVGSRNLKLALLTTLFIAFIMLTVGTFPRFSTKYLLIVTGGPSVDTPELMRRIQPYVRASKLRTANRNSKRQEFIFEICVRKALDPEINNSLMDVSGVESVNWVSESSENVG